MNHEIKTSIFIFFLYVLTAHPGICRCQAVSQSGVGHTGKVSLQRIVKYSVQKSNLDGILSELHKTYGLNFALDDKPLTERQDIDYAGTLSNLLDQIAERFDYSWMVSRSGIILMRKSFHKSQEMPQAHLTELRQSTRDLLSALSSVHTQLHTSDIGAMLYEVARSLSADQLRALRQRERIPVRVLPQKQYNLAKTAMYVAGFGPTCEVWDNLLSIYNVLPGCNLETSEFENIDQYNLFIVLMGKQFSYPFQITPNYVGDSLSK